MKIETAEDLENVVEQQNAMIKGMGEVLKGMDARIRLLTALIDSHHETLVQHGWAKARPMEKTPQ